MNKVLSVLILLITISVNAQSLAWQRCNAFGKGENLSNWLEATWQNQWPTPNGYTREDVMKMKEAGITSLRLPVCFEEITDTLAPYYVDTANPLWSRIDSAIQWANEMNMNLIIDNHHQWDIFNENWRTKLPRFAHLWAVVAQRYNYLDPNRFTFELLNEPAFGIQIDSLNEVFRVTIDTIRQYAPYHSIIVSPNFSSNGQAFANYQPLADTNLIYTWHSYDPYQFTHQGFSWANPPMPLGVTFPTLMTGLNNAWAQVVSWRSVNNRPVFLGEFGTGVFGDDVSRCNWIEYFGAKIDSFNMPWFYWDWRWDFSNFYSSTVSSDSVIPCFRHSLHLCGDTATAINTPVNTLAFNLLPNPANQVVECSLADNRDAQLDVYDVTGRLQFTSAFNGNILLSVGSWPQGIYLVYLHTADAEGRSKLLITH